MSIDKNLLLGCCVISAGIIGAGYLVSTNIPHGLTLGLYGIPNNVAIEYQEYMGEWRTSMFLENSSFPFILNRQGDGLTEFIVEILHPVTGESYEMWTHQINFGE